MLPTFLNVVSYHCLVKDIWILLGLSLPWRSEEAPSNRWSSALVVIHTAASLVIATASYWFPSQISSQWPLVKSPRYIRALSIDLFYTLTWGWSSLTMMQSDQVTLPVSLLLRGGDVCFGGFTVNSLLFVCVQTHSCVHTHHTHTHRQMNTCCTPQKYAYCISV